MTPASHCGHRDHYEPAGRIPRGLWLSAVIVAALLPSFALWAHAAPPAGRKVVLPAPADVAPVTRSVPAPRGPADFHSTHFLMHTDLAPKEAHALLGRLEVMLGLISKYWGQPPAGVIECYVVEDLAHWPEGSLDPSGRAKIQEKAGVTLVETLNKGNRLVAAKAVVYAAAEYGNPQHEAVHAYCGQTFGTTGPLWYSEGMAEMGQYWQQNDPGVHCHPYVIKYIRSGPPKQLSEILSDRAQNRTGDSWQNYAWRWALCHLLENNPNYSERFRALGAGFLSGQRTSFGDVFGSMLDEIAFEYRFFIRHVDEGYRVDLCSWDWKHKFRVPTSTAAISSRVAANRGWQPSGALLSAGKTYRCTAAGTWQLRKDGDNLSANGDPQGNGRLEGVIFQDFVLGEPFALSATGTFTAPGDGRLYLRCRKAWNELAENRGAVNVKIVPAGKAPAPSPGSAAASANAAVQDRAAVKDR